MGTDLERTNKIKPHSEDLESSRINPAAYTVICQGEGGFNLFEISRGQSSSVKIIVFTSPRPRLKH